MNEASESHGSKSESSASQLSDRSNCSSAAGLSKERQVHSVVSPRSVQISLSSSSSSSHPPRMNSSFSSSTPHHDQHKYQHKYQHHISQKHELQDIFATHQNIYSRPLQKEIMESSSRQHFDDDDDDDDYCTLPFLSIESIPITTTTSADSNSASGNLIGNSKSNHHVQLKQIIERQCSCSDEDDDVLPFSMKQQKQYEEVTSSNISTDNYNYNIATTAKDGVNIVTNNQFVSIDENNLELSSEYQNQNDQSLVNSSDVCSTNPSMVLDTSVINMIDNFSNKNNVDSKSDKLCATIGEDSVPPFALPLSTSDMKISNYSGFTTQNEFKFNSTMSTFSGTNNMASDHGESLSQSNMTNTKNNHKLLSSSSTYSNEYQYHSQVQNSSSNHNNDLINFSTLMRQLDDNNSFTATQTQSSNTLHKSQQHQDSKSHIGIQSPSMSLTHNLLRSTTIGRKGRAIALSDVTNDSFKLCVQLSPTVSVRDVVDVIANPDMLRFWCEPISALVVTDHKGGSAVSMTPSNNNDGRKKLNSHESYHYPNVEECDDDVIVPPAEDVVKINSKTLHQREEVS